MQLSATSPDKNSLEHCLVKAVADGYTESFRVISTGLASINGRDVYSPKEVIIQETCHFDQNEDPRYNSILYHLKTADGKKGVLIDSYGSYLNEKLVKFISQVPIAEQREHKKSLLTLFNTMLLKLRLTPAR